MRTGTVAEALGRSRAVLFDLDGTLLDSFDSHYRVYRAVFDALEMAFDEDAYARHYSPNWYLFYERLGLAQDRWAEADRLWLDHYSRESPQAREGAGELLRALDATGRALGLVTSGDRSRVERDLERTGWTRVFRVVVCGGDVPERKPHPAPLTHALGRLEVVPAEAAYVGDTMEDVAMGKAAGVTTVAVLGGFSPQAQLAQASPDFLANSLLEMLPQ